MKILILGVTGMLGNAMFRHLSAQPGLEVFGSARGESARRHFAPELAAGIVTGIDVENHDALVRVYGNVRPDVVVNCVGLVKQLADANDPLQAVPLNTLLPHRLAALCAASGSRLVHISTDCVFSGRTGNYKESDFPDAEDLYGRSKLMGEVDTPHAVTLRTSLIGHELQGSRSLVNWFLAQEGKTRGFTQAIFSGLPTIELSKVIHQHVLPNAALRGVYQVAAAPISKFDLLSLVADAYGKKIEIEPSDALRIDRSLDGSRFREATGYVAPDWRTLVQAMRDFG